MGTVLAINIVVLIMDGHLVIFHIWLISKGITTFEHIMYNREKRDKRALLKVNFKCTKTLTFQEGKISQEDYDDWLLTVNYKRLEKKSKVITKITVTERKAKKVGNNGSKIEIRP